MKLGIKRYFKSSCGSDDLLDTVKPMTDRQTDVSIATFLGWTDIEIIHLPHALPAFQGIPPGTRPSPYTGARPKFPIPHFESELPAAMKLVEKLTSLGVGYTLNVVCKSNNSFKVQIVDKFSVRAEAHAETLPQAVCRATLMVLGEAAREPRKDQQQSSPGAL